MTMVVAWLVYCGVIAAVLTAGAFAWEQSARWSGRPARWGWITALAAAVTVPWLLRLVPERTWQEVVPAALPVLPTMPAVPVMLEPVGSWSGDVATPLFTVPDVGLLVWATLSLLMLVWVGHALRSLGRARRRWEEAELDGGHVFLSDVMGPAALGLRKGLVVVPAWALELGEDVRRLLLAHEREHVRVGDPRLLFAGLLCVAAMPWNPLVWVMFLRLRNAIELDCDARVLAAGANPRQYGRLLLEVGQRRNSSPLVMATFAEPRVFLEERIRRIAGWPGRRNRARAAAAATVALALFATALNARDPLRTGSAGGVELLPLGGADVAAAASQHAGISASGDLIFELPPIQAVDPDAPVVGDIAIPDPPGIAPFPVDTPPAAQRRLEDGPVFTPMTVRPELRNMAEVQAALQAAYPATLRDAGIGGSPVVWFLIDAEGRVVQTRLSRRSGYPALDEAGLQVASVMQFTPALNRDQRVSVWVEIPIVFRAEGAAPDRVLRERQAAEVQQRQAAAAQDRRGEPAVTHGPPPPAFQVLPSLRNAADVQRELVRRYPPLLRDAGVGGSPVVWFYVGEDGRVLRTQLAIRSEHPALDEAALGVAAMMEFSPAISNGSRVAVWVEMAVSFGGAAIPMTESNGELVKLAPMVVQGQPGQARQPERVPFTAEQRTNAQTRQEVAPPPPPAGAQAAVSERPTFTPMTQRPELRNQMEVQQALVRSYPPLLRDAGIGGHPTIWVFIDDEGRVQRTQVGRSSGHQALDEAALNVASVMRFSPALNRDQRVAVWIEIPLVFTAR